MANKEIEKRRYFEGSKQIALSYLENESKNEFRIRRKNNQKEYITEQNRILANSLYKINKHLKLVEEAYCNIKREEILKRFARRYAKNEKNLDKLAKQYGYGKMDELIYKYLRTLETREHKFKLKHDTPFLNVDMVFDFLRHEALKRGNIALFPYLEELEKYFNN